MTDNIEWTAVYKSNNRIDAEILKNNIESAGIPCVMMNKQDSSYLTMLPGMVELHVPISQKEEAIKIINQPTDTEA